MGISWWNISWPKKNLTKANCTFNKQLFFGGPGCLPHRPTWAPCACHSHNLGDVCSKTQTYCRWDFPKIDKSYKPSASGSWSGYTWNFGILMEPSAIRMMIWIHLKFAGDLATSWKHPRSSQSGLRPQSEILSTESSIIWTQYQWRISSCRKVWKTNYTGSRSSIFFSRKGIGKRLTDQNNG